MKVEATPMLFPCTLDFSAVSRRQKHEGKECVEQMGMGFHSQHSVGSLPGLGEHTCYMSRSICARLSMHSPAKRSQCVVAVEAR
jgi:hypothetical protein